MLKRVWSHGSFRNFSKSNPRRNLEPSKQTGNSEDFRTLNYVVPGKWEKKILVYSGKYKSENEIPKRIPLETLDRSKSILRIRVGNLMMVGTVIAFGVSIWSGKEKAKQGITITTIMKEKLLEEERKAELREKKKSADLGST